MKTTRFPSRRPLRCALLAVLLASPAWAFGREEVRRSFQKSVALRPGQRLSMEHRNGDIRVRTHAEPRLALEATIRVSAPSR